MDKIVAGSVLMSSVADADGDYDDEEVSAVNDWLYYNVGIGGASPYIDKKYDITKKYLTEYGANKYEKKLMEDALSILCDEPLEYRQMVICFARQVARADWSFNDEVGNLSYDELDLLSYFCVKLDVDISDVPHEPPQPAASGCFVATAAYDTPFAGEIDVLRNWRDDFLAVSYPGRLFIKTYYSLSPPVAANIRESDGKRKVVRTALGPIVKILKDRYSD
tara:strand:+ start:260 stop:922 length:663 start_codon:yes stop_codon:yes gene_type:complete